MSLEGTMSVVGSEVMPLEYGGMDSESSPSPSSSERTVEERRERGIEEEEEEEIPSNIMEVEGNVDRCYDPDLGIVSEVREYGSELGSRGSLRGFVGNCNLPHHVLIRPVGWSRRDAEVEYLSTWKAKKTKQNDFKLNEDEVEEVGKLVREEGDSVDIMYLTSLKAIEAVELSEMEGFLNAVGGLAIPKKPRKKPEPIRRGSEEVSEEVAPLQRKKRKVVEPEARGDKVVEFVPRPSPTEVDPEVREREEVEVRGPGKGKELIPPPSFQKSLFEATNITGAKRFLNATLPESVSWVNALTQEYAESVKDRASLQRQCEELQKEKEELLKKNKEM
ncbi:hypothetical protein SLEP1_g33929 [Rubroshorea leprosula]|uniref:Uncharacterized protein n=1 Tax=Rubroshorea leprosula TaxID=152421 RepID=A0AAV5KI66_9ROSI|nr:hypothetical protein SLEP1_g33929 [Rubroshorea leprosula]